jgi:2-polyprenyl-3-methyl-5-hydroxy-6-metoxy-1,4-benzoquinol methylase
MKPGALLRFLTGRPWEDSAEEDSAEAPLSQTPAEAAVEAEPTAPEPVLLDFPGHLSPRFDHVLPACHAATDAVLALIPDGDYDRLALHSPGLKGYDWRAYISLSLIRLAYAVEALDRAGLGEDARILDFGSYFGNFALAARKFGCQVDALDSYGDYAPALTAERALLEANGVKIIDSSGDRDVLDRLGMKYDAIFLMGVIEHIPHSPRGLLQYVCRQLKPGGLLIVDTPNIAYAYRRRQLARGESVHPQIDSQFHCPEPFEGHHREFTRDEVLWMLGEIGLENPQTELFNYSIYGLAELTGDDAAIHHAMEADPTLRELIFAQARKPHSEQPGTT